MWLEIEIDDCPAGGFWASDVSHAFEKAEIIASRREAGTIVRMYDRGVLTGIVIAEGQDAQTEE